MPAVTHHVRIGALRHTVEIWEETETRDAAGGVVKTWSKKATRKAAIEPLKGREFFEAQQLGAEITHKVTMRYYDGLDSTDHRLRFGTRVFNIMAPPINVDERNWKHLLMCKETT